MAVSIAANKTASKAHTFLKGCRSSPCYTCLQVDVKRLPRPAGVALPILQSRDSKNILFKGCNISPPLPPLSSFSNVVVSSGVDQWPRHAEWPRDAFTRVEVAWQVTAIKLGLCSDTRGNMNFENIVIRWLSYTTFSSFFFFCIFFPICLLSFLLSWEQGCSSWFLNCTCRVAVGPSVWWAALTGFLPACWTIWMKGGFFFFLATRTYTHQHPYSNAAGPIGSGRLIRMCWCCG